jgi:aryl-alcohol dehydrogenase-like predicted oxidoreductase
VQTTQLGRSGLDVTRIGVGAWAMGGPSGDFNWGPQEDEASIAAIERAVECGVNWIDTAAIYGFGHSEEVVGRALQRLEPPPHVFTKCERVWDEQRRVSGSLKAASIRRELEASLRRLGVDAVDLYQIHWPQPDEEIEEGWSAICDLRREGKVHHAGVSNFDVQQLRRANAIGPVDSLQPPYSLLRRGIEDEILPYCQENGIGVIVYSPMASGLLSGRMTRERLASLPDGDWRRRSQQFQEPRLSRALELVEALREVGAAHGRSPGEVAIAWTLRHPAVTAAIVGVRSPEQVDGVVGAADVRLSDDEAARIDAASRRAA